MSTNQLQYNEIVDKIYSLPLEVKRDLKNLLENNIADERRNEIAENLRIARKEEKAGNLEFSSHF